MMASGSPRDLQNQHQEILVFFAKGLENKDPKLPFPVRIRYKEPQEHVLPKTGCPERAPDPP